MIVPAVLNSFIRLLIAHWILYSISGQMQFRTIQKSFSLAAFFSFKYEKNCETSKLLYGHSLRLTICVHLSFDTLFFSGEIFFKLNHFVKHVLRILDTFSYSISCRRWTTTLNSTNCHLYANSIFTHDSRLKLHFNVFICIFIEIFTLCTQQRTSLIVINRFIKTAKHFALQFSLYRIFIAI